MIFTPLLYAKAAAAAVLVGICLWGAATVRHWRNDSLRLDTVQAQAKQDVAEARQQVAALQTAYKRSQEASSAYQKELAGIAARPVPSGPIRLCRSPSVSRTPPTVSGPGPAVPTAGVGDSGASADSGAGPDIGPDLDALARKCDQVTAQGRALQELAQ